MLFISYILWHYTTALHEILILFKNFSYATWHKFFIWQHFKTLFSPWHKMRAQYMFPENKFTDKISNIIIDLFIRFIAMFVRLFIIITGLFVQGIVIVFFTFLFLAWIFWPIIFVLLISRGFALII